MIIDQRNEHNPDLEIRAASLAGLELREQGDGRRSLVGMAAVYGQLSEDLGGFREVIQAGAFASSLSGDIRALWQHDPARVLARTANGTLALSDTGQGLAVEIDPPDTVWARDALTQVARGDVDQMSFAFRVPPGGDNWAQTEAGIVRTVSAVDLIEVSIVTFPAYPQTSISVQQRSAAMRAQTRAAIDGDDNPGRAPGTDRRRYRLRLAEHEVKP